MNVSDNVEKSYKEVQNRKLKKLLTNATEYDNLYKLSQEAKHVIVRK